MAWPFVISNILLSHSARELMTVDHKATHRNKPEDFRRLFAYTVHMQRVIQVVCDGINTARRHKCQEATPQQFDNTSLGASWESC